MLFVLPAIGSSFEGSLSNVKYHISGTHNTDELDGTHHSTASNPFNTRITFFTSAALEGDMVSAHSDPKKVNLWTLGKYAGFPPASELEGDPPEAELNDSLDVLLTCACVVSRELVLCVIPPNPGLAAAIVFPLIPNRSISSLCSSLPMTNLKSRTNHSTSSPIVVTLSSGT